MKTWITVLAFTFCASGVLAEPPANSPNKAVSQLVTDQLLTPLQKSEKKRSRFSRAAPVPLQRRVRVLDGAAVTDARGREFVRFAIDERRAFTDDIVWTADSVLGCAYVNEREVFVKNGDSYLPASSLLGASGKVRPGVCAPAASPH